MATEARQRRITMNSRSGVGVTQKLQPEKALDSFLKNCKSRNLSQATYNYYKAKVGRFLDWYPSEDMNDIQPEHIDSYILYLRSEYDVNSRSINTHLRAVKTFLNYLFKRSYIDHKITITLLKTDDNDESMKHPYTNKELKAILKKPDVKSCSFAEYRTWAAINWLLATGCRLRSLVNVKIEDVDFDMGMLYLRKTKNRRSQALPISRELEKNIKEYLTYRGGEPDDYLFCTEFGEKMTKHGMRTAIRRYNRKRGVDKTSVHLFRHTFAKIAVMNGIDPLRLQKILGHSTLDMTRKYVNLYADDLKEGFDQYNPLDNLSGKSKHIQMR